jgi:glycosyltransferase involved in cell wall biosynthesis
MRILNVTQTYAPFFEFGGPPAKVRALSEGLAARGHQVTVLTADWSLQKRLIDFPHEPKPIPGPFGLQLEHNGVTAIYLPTWLRFRAITWNPALRRYLRARVTDFDIVHIFGLYDFLGFRVASACRSHNIPYVVEPIGMFVPIVRSLPLKRFYHNLFGKKMVAGAAAIIATAEQEKSELMASGIPVEKIVVRRNGVDLPDSLSPRGAFRDSLHIPDHAKLLLFLGRLSSKKSPDLLLNAFAEVLGRNESLRDRLYLAFVGPDEGGMRSTLQSAAVKFGLASRVHFAGPLSGDSKWSAYRDADIFVLPSQNENFGNTAAESVAVGTPVILSDRCGIAPLLADIAGLVVPHNQARLASAIESLLLNDFLYHKLHQGCAAAVTSLDWNQPLDDMVDLYRTLAGPLKS